MMKEKKWRRRRRRIRWRKRRNQFSVPNALRPPLEERKVGESENADGRRF